MSEKNLLLLKNIRLLDGYSKHRVLREMNFWER